MWRAGFGASREFFENLTLVARRTEHFRDIGAIFNVAELPQKRGVLIHKNSLAPCRLVLSKRRALRSDVSSETK